MEAYKPWIEFALFAVTVAGGCCIMGAIAGPIREALQAFFSVFYRPVSAIHANSRGWGQAVKAWLLREVADESDRKGDSPVYFIIGSAIYSLLTALFVAADIGLIIATFSGLGLEAPLIELPFDTSTLTGLTLVGSTLFFGSVMSDLLGVTRLAPWRRYLSEAWRRFFIVFVGGLICLSVSIGAAAAWWRAYMLVDFEPAATAVVQESLFSQAGAPDRGSAAFSIDGPEGTDKQPYVDRDKKWIIYFCLVGIAIICAAASVFSFAGFAIACKFLIISAISILAAVSLLPVVFLSWAASTLIDSIFNLASRLLEIPINIGNIIMRWFRFGRPTAVSAGPAVAPAGSPVNEPSSAPSAGRSAESSEPGFNPFQRRR
jgi:hypothetical protein